MNNYKFPILGNELIYKIEFMIKKIPKQSKEIEIGNREYKINLDYSDNKKSLILKILSKKATQMNYRLYEGGGKAVYFLGIEDNGYTKGISLNKMISSLYFFNKIVNMSDANFNKIRIYNGENGFVATIRVNKICKQYNTLLEF